MTPPGKRGRWFPKGRLLTSFLAVNVRLYRLFRGRLLGPPMLLLITTGARTGAERVVPLRYFKDGDDAWLVIASAGGAARHPAWYRNLAAHPDDVWIEVGGRRLRVTAESLHGADREERWRWITSTAANFAAYERSTDRELPVVRLRPAE
ncbi:MAG TPA: nitroreductase/quinone reductase family protein [Candidatus Dormibacteraeota bacterium]|jgi:deazaflavin-dependent oxidoreductase (nitroreductase family)|nr:nitroreductase/quinone reductase family protein [Candidatus Dormibacteraeota bacterium]